MSEEASIRSLAGDFGWDKLCRSLLRFWEKRGLEFPVFLFSVLICRCFFFYLMKARGHRSAGAEVGAVVAAAGCRRQ
jgi:hypothetical protein